MKTVRILGKGKMAIEDVPDPTPDDQSVIVKVKASALCGGELHEVRSDAPVQTAGRYNSGHEVVGKIVYASPNSPYPMGTRVGTPFVQR